MVPQTRMHVDDATEFNPTAAVSFIYRRRAVRAYEPVAVDDWTIRLLLDAAVHAPTAMHQEPWRFVVVQDRAIMRAISDRAKARAIASAAKHGNLLKPPGASGDGIRSILADPQFNVFYDATTLVAICGDTGNEFVAADCWLAAENFMLAAAAVGLGTCVIAFAAAAMNSPWVKESLGIPTHLSVIAPITLGVPRGEPLPSPRKSPVVLNWLRG